MSNGKPNPTDPLAAAPYFWPAPPPWSDTKHDPDTNKYIRGYCVIDDDLLLFDINNTGDLGNPILSVNLQLADAMVM